MSPPYLFYSRDGFVLVGSVAGQRYWSSMLNLEFTHITCGVWTPDDKLVLFGTADGQIIVMDVHGAMITQVTYSCVCSTVLVRVRMCPFLGCGGEGVEAEDRRETRTENTEAPTVFMNFTY